MKKGLFVLSIIIAAILADEANAEPCLVIQVVGYERRIDPKLLEAILTVESNLDVSAINHKTLDYGIGQINYRTIASYKFNKERLTKDEFYSVDAAAQVLLALQKQYAKREPATWLCRYNIGSRAIDKKRAKLCLNYLNKVEKAKGAPICKTLTFIASK